MSKGSMAQFLFTAYGPSLFASFGFGAIIPIIPIHAQELGAAVGLAALIAALDGLGQLCGDLPSGVLADRFGEKICLAAACLIDAVMMLLVFFVGNLWLFALVVLIHGMTGAMFGLARQNYLTVAVPIKWRARAMSALGGIFRVGSFLGPLVGSVVISHYNVKASFLLASAMSFVAAMIALGMPDLPNEKHGSGRAESEHITIASVLLKYRRALLRMGVGVLSLMLMRAARQTFVPLWCSAHGIDPSTSNIIYSVSVAFELVLFIPGGMIFDRFGRFWGSVPTIVVMALTFAIFPFTSSEWSISVAAGLLGIANGMSSGMVMTLGADLSPERGRPQFLAGWRVFSDIGTSGGPLLISAVTAIASLAASGWVLAVVGLAGALWMGHLLPLHGALRPVDADEPHGG